MRLKRNIIVAIACLLIIDYMSIYAQSVIPTEKLTSPVLIEIGTEFGSGFMVRGDKGGIFIVTAKHVLFKEGKLKSYKMKLTGHGAKWDEDCNYKILINLDSLNFNNYIKSDTLIDAAIIKIGNINDSSWVKLLAGIKIEKKCSSVMNYVPISALGGFEDVIIGNDVFIFGFPNTIGLKNIEQIDYERVLVKKGIISGINYKKNYIILDCEVYPGNSGGPVLQINDKGIIGYEFKIIGLIIEYVPFNDSYINQNDKNRQSNFLNSGYSIAIPLDRIKTMIMESDEN